MRKLTLTILLCLFSTFVLAEESILKRVKELQKTARLANGGALGDGMGNFNLIVGEKVLTISYGLDPVHVFGNEINIEDLKIILKSRIDSYTNRKSPMYGDYSDLCYVTLDTIKLGLDPSTIPILEALLVDESEAVRAWSVIALLYMAEKDSELKHLINDIAFPQSAIDGAVARGIDIPQWIKIKSEKQD